MSTLKDKEEIVTCPLCKGHGEIEKKEAVSSWRSMEFRESMRKIEGSLTRNDEEFAHYSWKD